MKQSKLWSFFYLSCFFWPSPVNRDKSNLLLYWKLPRMTTMKVNQDLAVTWSEMDHQEQL